MKNINIVKPFDLPNKIPDKFHQSGMNAIKNGVTDVISNAGSGNAGNNSSGGSTGGGGNGGVVTSAPSAADTYANYLMQLQERQRQERERAYQAAAAQQKQNLVYGQGQVNDATDKALREAYVNKMMALKDLPQALTAQGLNGGAAESTTAGMYNNYSNARNSLETERQAQLSSLLNTYQNNMAQLEAQRASGAAASLSELAPQLMNLYAQNGVSPVSLMQGSEAVSSMPRQRRVVDPDTGEEYYITV